MRFLYWIFGRWSNFDFNSSDFLSSWQQLKKFSSFSSRWCVCVCVREPILWNSILDESNHRFLAVISLYLQQNLQIWLSKYLQCSISNNLFIRFTLNCSVFCVFNFMLFSFCVNFWKRHGERLAALSSQLALTAHFDTPSLLYAQNFIQFHNY